MEDVVETISEWPVIQDVELKVNNTNLNRQTGSLTVTKDCHKKRSRTYPDCSFKKYKYDHATECLVNTALAKWWRHNSKLYSTEDIVNLRDCHPNTRIKMIAGLPAAKDFIGSEIKRLQNKLSAGHMTADVHAAIGTFLEKNGEIEKAVDHLIKAVKLQPEEKEYKWLLHKAEKSLKIKKIQVDELCKVNGESHFPVFEQVERLSVSDLTLEDFFYKYECRSTPVVLTEQKVTTIPWTLEHIKQKAGDCRVTLKKPVKQSVEWARLENSETMSVSSFIDKVVQDTLQEPLYLFDWSIPLNCQTLAEELIIPKYFSGDFLQRSNEGSLYKDSWPSLFIAPAGITSELHVDAFGSNFWMALFQGRKRWTFFPPTNVPYLYPEYENSLDPVFDVDLSNPDLDKHPLLQLTTPIECILEPGEILFVPAGCPHRVENLEPSLAISANFVDMSNFKQVKNELKINSLLDSRSEDLLKQFNDCDFNDGMDLTIQDQPYMEYKKIKV